ncbi:helix-turn-helix transcriptional regulator [Nocardioides sp. zg-1308]|uniref:helix-turn-helix domain-containing protein n=1 Tax=Nocardioides TaxID=1839 RepID=UPI0015565995|nr:MULTISPECIES: AraC family transcriptional regulator [unclassified Nocardioides]NPD04903.1 helix-turn-helix transcriptional regulator [Nocardioides sp. zg-1308]WQQ22796.1 AraC family transcriptional regulator [Nocardioides sp. S-34]
MSELMARRGSPPAVDLDFEGGGDEARHWLDTAYGTTLRLTGRMGAVSHHRRDHGGVAFDQLRIDSPVDFDSDAMPFLVVVDVLHGAIEYSRGDVTDRRHDGGTVLAAGWDMPFAGRGEGYEVRNTTITAEVLTAAVEDVVPDYPWEHISFTSFVPRTPEAGARWRATVDQMSASFPGLDAPLAHGEASRLLGHTLLQTFPNNVLDGTPGRELQRDARDATPSAVLRAQRFIESCPDQDLSLAVIARACRVTPRALQYAFRRHLGCTPMAYVRRVRLDLVRQSLRDGSALTVSDGAARFGFYNPGRFATEYRHVFEENPSETLHRAGG